MGEVHTGLLHHSTAVSADTAARVLDLVLGQRVWRSDRPIPQVISPPRVTGVDCHLPVSEGSRPRVIGSILSRAVVTGGHILQGSAYASVDQSTAGRRLPWAHYLSRPGHLETVGKTTQRRIADGFLAVEPAAGLLDLGAIGARIMDAVQRQPELNHRTAFRCSRTQFRWVAVPASSPHPDDDAARVVFRTTGAATRTLSIVDTSDDLDALVQLCEDVALHDWLLTTLVSVVERSRIGTTEQAAVIARLRPAVDYLLHLWMPAARVDRALTSIWDGIERRPGFSRQWRVNVDRIRDQLVLGTMDKLGASSLGS